jgi:2-polyprenyl-3-methyl-5-hydroxy-6-metoxy-1,4-benzoquinol methylase
LRVDESSVVDADGRVVAPVVRGIARFVTPDEDYAGSFGWQWKRWESTLSDARSGDDLKRALVLERTRFDPTELEGATILECGMGGGDDTEVLLSLPFGEVHSFDLSGAVDRAARLLEDPRLVLSQASIFEIPYADAAFDVVYCHRVIQHTPDPPRAVRCIAAKVKPGGLLFVHSYNRSWRYLLGYKYRYRWITRRLSPETLAAWLERVGPHLHRLNGWLAHRGRLARFLGTMVVPFEPIVTFGDREPDEVFDVALLSTFDALSPRYDQPMRPDALRDLVESEGFQILHLQDDPRTPVWCTARRLPR